MILEKIKSLLGHQRAERGAPSLARARDPGPLPSALAGYFERIAVLDRPDLHLLGPAEVAAMTADLASHPIVLQLGGWVLDDPGCSNFHLYLSAPELAGSVLYLSHDGDSQVVFPSLDAFLAAAQAYQDGELDLRDHHPPCAPPAADQVALSALVARLAASDGDDDEAVLLAVIPSLDAVASPVLERLARSDNFFVAEAAATLIERRPAASLWTMAQLCAHHPHEQAGAAGRRALAAIGGPDKLRSYAVSSGRQPSFEVAYRFLTPEEGGRRQPPWQHTRWDFLYAHDDPSADGIWMIYPEFIDQDRAMYPGGLVPASGNALMFLLNPDNAPYHRERIAIGTKGFFVEGAHRVAQCEVVAIHGLAL